MPPATSQIWRFSQGVYASGRKITFGKKFFYKWQLAHMIFQIVGSAQTWQSCAITYFRVHASVLTKSSLSLVVLGDQECGLFSLGGLQTFQSRNALSSFPSCYPWTLWESQVIPFLVWLPKDALSMSVSFQRSFSVPDPGFFKHCLCFGQHGMSNFCTRKVACGRCGQFLWWWLFLPWFCSIVI